MDYFFSQRKQWLITIIIVFCGAVCGIHIAKLGPSMNSLINEFSMSLTEAGILASTFTLLTIFIGIFVGNLMPGIGVKRLICLAMLLSASGSLLSLSSDDYQFLIIGRAFEGIGLIIMMIAGPTTVSMFTSETSRAKYTGAWAAFMPFGTAMSFLLAPLLIPDYGWRGLWWFSVGFSIACLIAALIWIPSDQEPIRFKLDQSKLERTIRITPLIWIGCIFAVHSLVFHVILQFIPIYGTSELGLSFTVISLTIAGFCLLNVFGNFISGYAIHRGIKPHVLINIHFLAVPLIAILLFMPSISDAVRLSGILIGALFTSLTPSAAFVLISKLASEKSDIPAFNGLMLQVQGAGILFGPSLTGWAVEYFQNWQAAGYILIAASVIVLLIVYSRIRTINFLTWRPA
jgi:DHA1 family inner membrane transport protein